MKEHLLRCMSLASLNDQEFRRIGSKSDGSAGETLSEPYWLCLTCCRCVDGLGLLRGARSGGSGACSTGTGTARHHRGTKGNRAVLVPFLFAGLCQRCTAAFIRTYFRAT